MTDKERLADWLGQWLCQRPEDVNRLAQNLLDKGVTLPPAPVDPVWMAEAVQIARDAWADARVAGDACWPVMFHALLAAGYRIIPPTQDRAAVIEKAYALYTDIFGRPGRTRADAFTALYDAGMLVEGDGR